MSEAPNTPIIRGEKVWLRGFREEDLASYESFVMEQDAQWAGYSLPTSAAQVRDFFDSHLKGTPGPDRFFVVCPLGSDEFVGTTWLWNHDSRLDGPEFSIFMHDPRRWGTGLGTDAINATMDYTFGFTEVERVWLVTMTINERAQRSFTKAGFVREGVVGHSERYRGPDGRSTHVMLRRDWEDLSRPCSWDL